MADLSNCYNIADIRRAAERRLPRALFEFIDRATEDEIAVRNNRAAIERIRLVPRAPRDVSNRSLATTLFGQPVALPMAIAPTGAAGLMWYEAEMELARAAKAAGIPYTMATGSMTPLEKVAREVGGRLWFQLYVWPDRDLAYALVRRVVEAGFEALVVTVDTPVQPNREYNTRNGFGFPFRPTAANVTDMLLHPRWLAGTLGRDIAAGGMPQQRNHPPEYNDPRTRAAVAARFGLSDTIGIEEIKRLRDLFPGKLLVKGIVHPDDAREAVQRGVDGIIVSNHGGRQVDGAIPALEAFWQIAEAVGDAVPLLFDSGVRTGADALKALALGTRMVGLGRPVMWALGVDGENGVHTYLRNFLAEFDLTLALSGYTRISDLRRESLHVVEFATII